jgi:hypothetical protein
MGRLHPYREGKWPHITTEGYDTKSPETYDYNCIAFAAGVTDEWWWPDQHGGGAWPIAKREVSVDCFVEAFRTKEYELCDAGLESEFERIAIYVLNGEPTHAARQLPDGKWVSKLGPWEDIQHNTTKAVEEYIYGKTTVYMKRKRKNT